MWIIQQNNQCHFRSGRTHGRKSSSFSQGRKLRMFVIKHFLYSIVYLIPPKRKHCIFNLIAPTHMLSAAMIASPQLSSRHCYSVPAVAPPPLVLTHATAICGLRNVLVCTLLPTVPRYFPPASFPSQRCLCHSNGPGGHAMVWPRRLDGRGVGGSGGGGCVGVGGYFICPHHILLHVSSTTKIIISYHI